MNGHIFGSWGCDSGRFCSGPYGNTFLGDGSEIGCVFGGSKNEVQIFWRFGFKNVIIECATKTMKIQLPGTLQFFSSMYNC